MARQNHFDSVVLSNVNSDTAAGKSGLDRRHFLKLSSASMLLLAAAPQLSGCGGGNNNKSDKNQTDSDVSQAYNAVKKTSFGVTPATLADIEALGIDQFLEQQLAYESIDDGNLEQEIASLFPLSTQSAADLYFGTQPPGFPDNIADVFQDVVSATQYRQFYSQRQLYEVMVDFWGNHFNIHLLNGLGSNLKPTDDRDVIRPNALGNFGDLLRASARSPAMLFYLDNYANVASAPNENYARELMELHTLGVDGGYTENDIKEVARCFTGWTLKFPDAGAEAGTFQYLSPWHDTGSKTVLGEVISAGGQQEDGERVLDILLAHPSTARFIARKLCQRFISDSPPQATISKVADAFTDSNGDIKSTLRSLFASDAFLESAEQKFTRPNEFLGQLVRGLLPDGEKPSDKGELFRVVQQLLGQLPFNWPTPDGYPDEASYWASTGGLLNRWRMSFLSLANIVPEINVFTINYTAMLNGADRINTIVDAMIENFLLRPISEQDRSAIIDWLESAYPPFRDKSVDAENASLLAALIAAVLISSPYYQLR